jgi:adenine-specific DNA-methyltransferase
MAIKNSKLTKFTSLLKELFQLNQPELDFGIYRIMHARKDDINRFIEKDLPKVVNTAFSDFESQDKVVIQQELVKAKKAAEDAGFDASQSPKVRELEAQYSQSVDTDREEGEVYDALLTFFSRYYDEGDFISRRVYKEGTYAIPYSGEEVTLHWANKDQYYIKSSESLRDFCFRLKSEQPENPMRVHFRVVDAEAGAQNNNKEADDAKRVFILDQENPWEIKDNELNIYFYYRASNLDDWTDDALEKATAAAKKKPPTLDHLKQIAEQHILSLNGGVPDEWRELLEVKYKKTDGELADYSVLMSQLNLYTKKNTFDYFIHKNLGEFLTRELDFYIKNELFRWEDISNMKSNPARLAPLLSKIEVIRTIGEKIIAFLAQLENFQKKLWLKKKFVTETNYCITLDRLAEQADLLAEITANELQRKQWQELVELDLEQFDQEIKAGDWITQSKYRYLMVDTGLFDQIFKARVMSRVDGLDEQCDGVLINGDNFHAQLLIRERLQGQVKISYIDPPYNTGKDGFLYKDNYLHSSWASFMYDRLNQTKALTSDDGATFISIDDSESQNIEYIGKTVFGEENHLVNFFIQVRYANKTLSEDSDFHKTIEKVLYFAKDTTKHKPNKTKAEYDVDKFTWSIEVSEPETSFEAGGRLVEVFTDGQYEINKVSPHLQGLKETWATGSLLRQKGSSGEYFGLNLAPRKDIDGLNTLYKVYGIGEDGLGYRYFTGPKKATATRGKFYSGIPLDTLEKINTGDSSKELPIHNFYDMAGDFGNCRHEGKVDIKGGKKPEVLLQQLINFSCNPDKEEWLLEPFSGSGTGVSVALKSGKKFIGLEQGSYFDEKIIRRLKYTAYGKSGEGERGISSCFKYIRLESYEDTLTNLQLKRTQVQQDLLSSNSADEQSARESYLLNYMLNVETQGSASLLDISKFIDPTAYQLKVRNPTGDETKLINVDLLETFNWLLGLTVEHINAPIYFTAELSQADHGRWQADVKRQADGKWWFRTVAGTNRKGQKILIVWRNLPSVIANEANGLVMDNAVLDAVLIDKLSVRMTESQDDEFDILYVNGDHNITIPKNRQGGLMESRVKLIEEDFHRLMFSSIEH